MAGRDADALRDALDARIVDQARSGGLSPGRLRRRLVFQRLLLRLGPDDRWVLKGGYLLEARLGVGARTTRDLDLATAGEPAQTRDAVEAALATDPDGDRFGFVVRRVASLPAPDRAVVCGWGSKQPSPAVRSTASGWT